MTTDTKKNAIKAIVTALVIASAVAYLIVSSAEEQTVVYYKDVGEVLANRADYEKEPVRVNGLLEPESIQNKPGTDEFKFILRKNEQTLEIQYTGILPDNMSEGKELIVEGTLVQGSNTLKATEILTKCPSKYETEAESRNEEPAETSDKSH